MLRPCFICGAPLPMSRESTLCKECEAQMREELLEQEDQQALETVKQQQENQV